MSGREIRMSGREIRMSGRKIRMSGREIKPRHYRLRMSGRKCSLAWELFFPGWFFDFVSPLPIPPCLQGEGE